MFFIENKLFQILKKMGKVKNVYFGGGFAQPIRRELFLVAFLNLILITTILTYSDESLR